jgi:hypothetical protein
MPGYIRRIETVTAAILHVGTVASRMSAARQTFYVVPNAAILHCRAPFEEFSDKIRLEPDVIGR